MSVIEEGFEDFVSVEYNPEVVAVLTEYSLNRFHRVLVQSDETGDYFYRETTNFDMPTNEVTVYGPYETANEVLWGINLL